MGLVHMVKQSIRLIYKHLIDVKDDGSLEWTCHILIIANGLTMTNNKFHKLFDGPQENQKVVLLKKKWILLDRFRSN